MVKCKNCGIEVSDEAKFCPNCGNDIIKDETNNEGKTKFCANCGYEMDQSLSFCPQCGTPTSGSIQSNNVSEGVLNPEKSSFLAAVLSFFIVGLGQIYIGLVKKGIILFIAAIISGVLIIFFVGWILWILVWIYSIYDAYHSSEEMKYGNPVKDTLDLNNLF